MKIDLTHIEAEVEDILDGVLAEIPGNPTLAQPVEREVLHYALVQLANLLGAKINGNYDGSAPVSLPSPVVRQIAPPPTAGASSPEKQNT